MDIKFLADRPDAVPTIARWYFDQWGHKEPGNSFEVTRDRLYTRLNKDCLPLPYIACGSDGEVIGAAQLKLHEMEDIFPDKEYWLGGVFVAPVARGRGVGQALVAESLVLAPRLGINRLWLQTVALDGGLYGRLGWKAAEKLHYRGEDVLVMMREVNV